MIRSMTGYARATVEHPACSAEVELRSVNHRFLDVHVRLPAALASFEGQLRQMLATRLQRGKVDVSVRLKPKAESVFQLEVDRPLVRELVRAAQGLGAELGIVGTIEISDLLSVPQALNLKEKNLAESPATWPAIAEATEKALEALDGMRRAEGHALAADLAARVAALAEHLGAIETLSVAGRERRRQELLEKVTEVASAVSLDPQAVAMEVARLVERADITEEVTRFKSHLALWQSAVANETSSGKKLDFIVQELGREVNTIGSKCQDAAITAHVIELKAELERVREQVQNVE